MVKLVGNSAKGVLIAQGFRWDMYMIQAIVRQARCVSSRA
jgi:hypothetical protein